MDRSGNSTLPGVGCAVTSCAYNGSDHMCHASHITVEKQCAQCDCDTDTFCSTFIEK